MEKDMAYHAKTALFVQSASNIGGVAHSFQEAVEFLGKQPEFRSQGTEWRNKHPIVVLFATQIHHLAGLGISDIDVYDEAYKACKELAGEKC